MIYSHTVSAFSPIAAVCRGFFPSAAIWQKGNLIRWLSNR